MADNPIEGMMKISMDEIRQMVDANTIIGETITAPDGTLIIPVSKVSYGFVSGGSEFPTKKESSKDLFGGGSSAGITMTPVAFLTISEGKVQMLHVGECNSSIDKIIDMAPGVISKIGDFLKSKKDKKKDIEKVED